jgi:hypothetical protein
MRGITPVAPPLHIPLCLNAVTRRLLSCVLITAAVTPAQVQCYNCDAIAVPRQTSRPDSGSDPKLPDGTSQKEAILKSDHEASVKDSVELMKLAESLKADLDKNDRHLLSVSTLKTLDDIEKIAKRIRKRMKRL